METDAYISPIGTYGAQVALPTFWVEKFTKFIHDPDLRVRIPVIFCLHLPLHMAWNAAAATLRLPPLVLLGFHKFYQYGGVCNTLDPFHYPPKLFELQQVSCIHVVQARHVTRV